MNIKLLKTLIRCVEIDSSVEGKICEMIVDHLTKEKFVEYGLRQHELDNIINIGQNEGKFQAVKQFKDYTRMPLMDSKRAVEEIFLKNGYKFKQPSF